MNPMAVWVRWLRVGVAAALLSVQLDGCATTGGHSSGITKPWTPDPDATEQLSLTSVSTGTFIRVVLRNDSLVSGKYQGVIRMAPEAYEQRVADFLAARKDTTPLPGPGTKITVRRKSKERIAYLDGFGYRSLELRWKPASNSELLSFDDLESVTDATGHVWTRDALWFEARLGRIPSFSELLIQTESGDRRVPVDQVTDITFRNASGQWVPAVLVVIGLGVVVLLAIGAAPYYYMGCADWSYQRQLGLRNAP